MNYYQYKRRAPRSRGADYIKPFLVIILFIGIIFAAWRLMSSLGSGGGQSLSSEKVFLTIENGSAEAMTSGSTEWKSVPSSIYLYEGEKIKTQSDGQVTLNFFEKDAIRMDKSSELKFTQLKKDSTGNQSTVELADGKMWAEINTSGTTPSQFAMETPLLSLKSDGGVFALSYPGMLYVMEGSVKAEVKNGGKIVKSATIGVGQELIVDEQIASDMADGLQKEVIFALDDTFKTSDWYAWNQSKSTSVGTTVTEGEKTSGTSTTGTDATLDGETTSSQKTSSDSTTDTLKKTDEKESVSTTSKTQDTEVKTVADETDTKDVTAPDTPKITDPGNNGDTVILKDVEQVISGTVSADTDGVIVNDYRLGQYKPGSGKFSYFAKVAYGNLKVGDNDYKVTAVDKAGNKSKTATITLTLPKSVSDTVKPASTTDSTTTPKAATSGGVKITSPNGGENLVTTETSFVIKGEAPDTTAKVLVNGYQLQAFKLGDTTFKYNASSTLGTLKVGSLNTYTAKAFDADGNLIGSATMTIDASAATPPADTTSNTQVNDPVITMPSAAATYDTTLDQLVIGGSIGKDVETVYLNGIKIDEYVAGSESWKKTLTLTPGENTFTVYGMVKGVKTKTDSIKITYQN